MKVLVICDDCYHSGAIVKEGMEFLTEEFDIEFLMDMTGFDPKSISISNYDVIAICKDNQISPSDNSPWFTKEVEETILGFAEQGGGLMAIHAGTVLCRRSQALKELVGCSFSHHPEQCDVEYKIISGNNIVAGAASFTERDEHYFIDFDAVEAEVFLESISEHGSQPAGYIKKAGDGKVCVLTPGHNIEVWKNKEYMSVLKNAFLWCGAKEK